MLRQQKLQEHVGEVMLLVHHADHLIPRNLQSDARRNRGGRRQAKSRRRHKRLFSNKIPGFKKRDRGFLAHRRNHRHSCPASLQIENRVRRFSLCKEGLFRFQSHNSSSQPCIRQEGGYIKLWLYSRHHGSALLPRGDTAQNPAGRTNVHSAPVCNPVEQSAKPSEQAADDHANCSFQ